MPRSGQRRLTRHAAPSTSRAASASASRSSMVPLLPISPAVRSQRPTRTPRSACRTTVPPIPISMSSGCGPKASRSTVSTGPLSDERGGRWGRPVYPSRCLRPLDEMSDPSSRPADVTRLLQEWRSGRKDALDRLMPLVYDELHFIASRHRSRERSGGPLQTTALVNEAYLKLVGQRDIEWQNRSHFFAIAATLMRRILVDQARREHRPKHGGDVVAVSLDDVPGLAHAVPVDAVDAITLDSALSKLETIDPR